MCGRRVNGMCGGCEWHDGVREDEWTGAAWSRAETPTPPYPKASGGFPNNTTSTPSACAACARGTTKWASCGEVG